MALTPSILGPAYAMSVPGIPYRRHRRIAADMVPGVAYGARVPLAGSLANTLCQYPADILCQYRAGTLLLVPGRSAMPVPGRHAMSVPSRYAT
eukprot:3871735-Rhodomonas_salina.1